MIDIYPGKPATVTAANNVVRCLLGAAATSAIIPMSEAMGNGWVRVFGENDFSAKQPVGVERNRIAQAPKVTMPPCASSCSRRFHTCLSRLPRRA